MEMDKQQAELTAYCGLYCGDCLRYRSKVMNLTRDLADELQAMRFNRYAEVKSSSVKEFKGYSTFNEVLDAISNLRCDTPCRSGGDGCLQPCDIKRCVLSKNLAGCWECKEFGDCDKFQFFEVFHGNAAKENLRKIKKYGLDRWAEHREKFYVWS